MFSIINVSNNYKMDHSYNDNDRSSPFKQNSIWKYACWRLSVTNQKFSSAEGHKHEGGASSIVFHRSHPSGETFFLLTHEKRKWLQKRKFEQVDPGGDVDEYEYADSKEVDAKAKEKKAKGQDDGDRLVGGKITSTRFGTEVLKALKYH